MQDKFDEIVRPVLMKRDANDAENKALAQIRDLLLPKLISGELRVSAAERLLEAAA